MNRRGFLGSLVALPVAAFTVLTGRRFGMTRASMMPPFERVPIQTRRFYARIHLSAAVIEASRYQSGQFARAANAEAAKLLALEQSAILGR